eukprot:scaffold60433_cov66-Phaeocystis_antarctica.AAC.1
MRRYACVRAGTARRRWRSRGSGPTEHRPTERLAWPTALRTRAGLPRVRLGSARRPMRHGARPRDSSCTARRQDPRRTGAAARRELEAAAESRRRRARWKQARRWRVPPPFQ